MADIIAPAPVHVNGNVSASATTAPSYEQKYHSLKRKYKETIDAKVQHDKSLKKAWDTITRLRQEKELLLERMLTMQDDSDAPLSDSDDSIFTEIKTASTATSHKTSPTPVKTEPAKRKKSSPKAKGGPKLKPGPKVKKQKAAAAIKQEYTGEMTPTTIVGTNSKRHTKPKRLKKPAIVSKTYKVPKVERGSDGRPKLPMQIGILTLHSLGDIVYNRRDFHNERYIFPVGYKVTRMYHSMINANEQVLYTCWISDGGDGPRFHIDAADQPDKKIIAGTATGAWTAVVKEANNIRARDHSNSASGPDYFGFSQTLIRKLIQELPNVDKCTDYVSQEFIETAKSSRKKSGVDDPNKTHAHLAPTETSSVVDDSATLPSRHSSIDNTEEDEDDDGDGDDDEIEIEDDFAEEPFDEEGPSRGSSAEDMEE